MHLVYSSIVALYEFDVSMTWSSIFFEENNAENVKIDNSCKFSTILTIFRQIYHYRVKIEHHYMSKYYKIYINLPFGQLFNEISTKILEIKLITRYFPIGL